MPESINLSGNLDIYGDLVIGGTLGGQRTRKDFTVDSLAAFPIPLESLRDVTDYSSLLGSTANVGANRLGLYTGTFGTGLPYVATGDIKGLGALSMYGRVLVQVPPNYVPGGTMKIRGYCGMLTTLSDHVVYFIARPHKMIPKTILVDDIGLGSVTDMNSLTFAPYMIDMDTTQISPGDILDVEIELNTYDTSAGTAVVAAIADLSLLCDVQS